MPIELRVLIHDGDLLVTKGPVRGNEYPVLDMAQADTAEFLRQRSQKIAFLRSRIIGLYRALKEAQNG